MTSFVGKIGWPEAVMDGAVYRGVGEEGHGQGHHACSVNITWSTYLFVSNVLMTTKK